MFIIYISRNNSCSIWNCTKWSNDNKIHCTKDSKCPNDIYDKLIHNKKECIDNCSKDNEYRYQFRKDCYKECPEKTEKSEITSFYCNIICSSDFPFVLVSSQECVSFCGIDFL